MAPREGLKDAAEHGPSPGPRHYCFVNLFQFLMVFLGQRRSSPSARPKCEPESVAGFTRPIVSYTYYLFDFAGKFRTRFTTDCESRNMRAIAAGFMPVE